MASTECRALFLWDVAPDLRDRITERLRGEALRLVFPDSTEPERLGELARGATALVGWRPTPELLEAAADCRLFVNPGAGVQRQVPVIAAANAARATPITLVNGHGNAGFTAQCTVALLLALANRVVTHHAWMAAGRWRTGDEEAASIPLAGRHVGLLGYGAVNQHVHRYLSGFDLRFSCLTRGEALRVPEADLPTPLARHHRGTGELAAFLDTVDTLVVAVPETEETRALVGAEELGRLGERGLLVNVGRGPIVEEEALYRALSGSTIAGAAIDVWYDYSPEPDEAGRLRPHRFPFHDLQNVVLSPHRAASPFDDLDRWDDVIDNLARHARGEPARNVVDLARGY